MIWPPSSLRFVTSPQPPAPRTGSCEPSTWYHGCHNRNRNGVHETRTPQDHARVERTAPEYASRTVVKLRISRTYSVTRDVLLLED